MPRPTPDLDQDIYVYALWLKTRTPLSGDIAPRDMIRYGRYEKLRRFIMNALEDNAAVTASMADQTHAESKEKAT
jgi:hypothetical protein